MRPDQRICAGVMQHSGRGEIVEIGWHRNRSAPIIHHRSINRNPPSVHGAGGIIWVGNVIIFGNEPPQLRVHFPWSIGIPNFQSVLATAEDCLHFD